MKHALNHKISKAHKIFCLLLRKRAPIIQSRISEDVKATTMPLHLICTTLGILPREILLYNTPMEYLQILKIPVGKNMSLMMITCYNLST
jgi:hypothetical protein